MQRKWKRYLIYVPFVAGIILFLLLYRYSFPQGDDFTFASRGRTLASIGNFYKYYYTYAGSHIANSFAQILLLNGLFLWKILTPFVIEGTGLLLFYASCGHIAPQEDRWKRDFSLACICAFFPGLFPLAHGLFGDTFVWMDGSCNYLYPMLFLLIGVLPFWNALRGRPLSRPLQWICPIFFVVAGLMHEQIAVALFVFCMASLFLLKKQKPISPYFLVLFILSAAILIFTFTCPGAYYRLSTTSYATTNHQELLIRNLINYFSVFNGTLWPVSVLMGLCSLYFLHQCPMGRFPRLLKLLICLGCVLSALAKPIGLPAKSIFWVFFFAIYYLAILLGFLLTAHEMPQYQFLPALYLSLWSSQAIPAVLGAVGRPMFPLIILTLLLALSTAEGFQNNHVISVIEVCAAVTALLALLHAIGPFQSNFAAYQDIERQVNAARFGQSNVVTFDQRKLNKHYCYFNAFSQAYHYDIQQYYGLNAKVKIRFIASASPDA
jgi:hypothetical protein